MDKAFDAILQLKVDATVIAKMSYYSGGGQFRYQCLYCGEEVYLAAAGSNEKAPHFRHRRGNNDKNCEKYLGQVGAIEHYVSVRRNKHEHIEFYFNKERMTFEISATFSEEELRDFEQNKNRLDISAKLYASPFLSVPVNKGNFAPDVKNYFILNKYSNDYYISFGDNKKVYSYCDVIKRNGSLNIYKVRLHDKRAKLQGTNMLFTKVTYIAISEDENIIQELMEIKNCVFTEEKFEFCNMGVNFYGITFSINNINYVLKLFFQKSNYQIEVSESLDILWPPVFIEDSDFVCNDDKIYANSSFKLVPHGNININESFIQDVDENISKIFINEPCRIYEKNIDVSIKKANLSKKKIACEKSEITFLSKYVVPSADTYFLFDENGYTRLAAYSTIYLAETDKIIGYKNGHIKVIICGCSQTKMKPEDIIYDILRYHPQSEKYNPDEFINVVPSEAAVLYLEKCYRNGKINTVVKRYIKEGLI